MNKHLSALLFALLLPSMVFAAPKPKDAKEVMANYEKANRQILLQSQASMTNKEADGTAKVKKFTWWRKLDADGVRYRTLTLFSEPAEIRGEQILFNEKEGGQADVLLYLPAYKKTRRVEKQSQGKSFMSSEFSYADIATPHLDDFNYKMAPEDKCLDQSVCYVIEVTPKTDEVRERTGYSRTTYWMRADNFMISKAEYSDLSGKVKKRLSASQTEEVDKVNHRWMSKHLEMENLTNGRRTIIQFENVNTKDPIPDSKFSPQNLGRG